MTLDTLALTERPRLVAPRPTGRGLRPALALMTLLCLLLLVAASAAAWYALSPETIPQFARPLAERIAGTPPAAVQKPATVPAVEPVQYLAVPREEARRINAAIPFSTRPNPAAAPFVAQLSEPDMARAVDCLAAAAWYEAGDDPVGEQAVVQVVLNRMRHPAFPSSICGVVFQGAERTTGCQFSFTCDGAMARTPSPVAWERARAAGRAGLSGLVSRAVGWSTHYHTDWVVPYWSSNVDKVAEIHTHLFFRWRGGAGEPRAFRQGHAGAEPTIGALARLSPAHRLGTDAEVPVIDAPPPTTPTIAAPPLAAVPPVSPTLLRGNALADRRPDSNAYVIRVPDGAFPGDLALTALGLCKLKGDAPCTVYGSVGGTLSLDPAGRPNGQPDFYYFRDTARGRETAQWNCARWKRADARQCLKG